MSHIQLPHTLNKLLDKYILWQVTVIWSKMQWVWELMKRNEVNDNPISCDEISLQEADKMQKKIK